MAVQTESGGSSPPPRAEGRPTTLEALREVRLAIVMYGGSSLAVYINGVAQELLHLVCATAPKEPDGLTSEPLRSDDELRETEGVYRRLGQLAEGESVSDRFPRFAAGDTLGKAGDETAPILTRFVVDIISGTSAGGINGIYLAKALATNRDLASLKQLWVEEGDIGKLINDKESVRDLPGLKVEDPPASLLNGARMYWRLLQAFEGMDPAPPPTPIPDANEDPVNSPLADQLDLFVTTTDLSGLVLPIELADKVIGEPRHRNVYHFLYATEQASGDYRNDFVPKFNPFLAFAARCTSSLPFVFPPMTLDSIDAIVRQFPRFQLDDGAKAASERWNRFISDYIQIDADGNAVNDFSKRAFGDGGALDNAPFSYAIDAMFRRRADIRVERKLFYIEPDPKIYAFGQAPDSAPDAITNVLGQGVTLPRTETIREDLMRVLDRNRQTARMRRVLTPLQDDIRAFPNPETTAPVADDTVRASYLDELIPQYGVAYGTYQRLRVAELTDDLARLFCRLAGLNEDSDDFFAVRYLVRAWRDRHFAHFRPNPPESPQRDPFGALLLDCDIPFELRRLRHLIAETDALVTPTGAAQANLNGDPRDVLTEALAVRGVANDGARALRRLGRVLRAPDQPGSPALSNPVYAVLEQQDAPTKVRSAFAAQFRKAIEDGVVQAVPGEDPGRTADRWTRTLRGALNRFLTTFPDEEARERIASLVETDLDNAFQAVMNTVRDNVREGLSSVRASVREALSAQGTGTLQAGQTSVRSRLDEANAGFAYQDVLAFPIEYGTDFGETSDIDIFRISPKDAVALVKPDPNANSRRSKVAGAQYGHFGAFFERVWRQNDILWGRLDGAERLIEALTPPGPSRAENVSLLRDRAFGEILWAELTESDKQELAGVMATALAQLPVGDRSTQALAAFLEAQVGGPIEPRLQSVLLAVVERREDLVAYYRTSFDLDTRLKPAPTFRNAGRAAHVMGDVLNGIAQQRGTKFLLSPTAWLSRVGRLMTGIVEAATPGSTTHVLVRHWLVLAYLVDLVLILGGGLLGQPAAQHFGWTLLWITIGGSVVLAAFADLIRGRSLWKAVVRAILALFVLGLLAMVGLEFRHLASDLAIRPHALSSPPGLPVAAQVHDQPWKYVGGALAAAVAWGLIVLWQGRKLRLPLVPSGIVAYELAGTRERAKEIRGVWINADRLGTARLNLVLDVVFIVLYSTALYLAVAWGTPQWTALWPFLSWVGWFLAWGMLLAGVLDLVEDGCLWKMLSSDDPGSRLPALARRAAEAKFLLVSLGIVYVVASLVRHLVA